MEITDELWRVLIMAQSNGLRIIAGEDGKPLSVECNSEN